MVDRDPGEMRVRKDRQGRVIERLGLVKEGKHANDLQLSIDQRVQALAYRALKRATDENKATSGSMVMLDVKTGEVLAMVNTPPTTRNNRGQYQSFRVRNRVVTDTYEPGSTVKPFDSVECLQAGVTSWKDFIPGGPLFIGAKQIRDVSIHKATNLYDILRFSSSIGMSRIAADAGPGDDQHPQHGGLRDGHRQRPDGRAAACCPASPLVPTSSGPPCRSATACG